MRILFWHTKHWDSMWVISLANPHFLLVQCAAPHSLCVYSSLTFLHSRGCGNINGITFTIPSVYVISFTHTLNCPRTINCGNINVASLPCTLLYTRPPTSALIPMYCNCDGVLFVGLPADGLLGLGVLGGALLVGGVVAAGAVALAGIGIAKLKK